MFETFSAPYRRTLALAILGLLIFALWDVLLLPASDAFGVQTTRLEALEHRYSRLKAAIEEGEQLIAAQQEWDAQTLKGHSVLNDQTASLAAATLQGRIKILAEENGLWVTRLQNLPVRREGLLERVSVRVSMDASSESLPAFLKALEEGAPALFVEVLEAESYDRAGRPPKKSMNRLKVSLDVYGYLWRDA